MITRIRAILLSINSSYWFFPALFATLSVILSMVTVYLDRNGATEWLSQFGWLHPSQPNGARTTLTVIAGSMIGVASTVFSITIAAVAYASGNYGPRLLTNFMQDRGNQLSLATFIGTFTYSLMILRTIHGEDTASTNVAGSIATSLPGFTPQLSLLVGTALALFSIAVLVYFLHHIPASIRINTVLEGIGERLVGDIKKRFNADDDGAESEEQPQGQKIPSQSRGYVQLIDYATLGEIAKKNERRIALQIRTGDFVHPDMALAELCDGEPDEQLACAIRDCFSFGGLRTPKQDMEFLIDELAEIAMRALSPGINDPFTANTAMHWMGTATAELARRNLAVGPEQEDYDRAWLKPLAADFGHFLTRGFGTMRSAVATSPLAAMTFLISLRDAATASISQKRTGALLAEGKLLLEQVRLELAGPSLADVERAFAQFQRDMQALFREDPIKQ